LPQWGRLAVMGRAVPRDYKKYGARVVGGLHIFMPDSVCDVKLLKKSVQQNKKL